ncbi:NAD(P)H-dependent oxidoreductase [Streptomyces echinoruber]|uniref:Flavodoxin-like fold domain-containing protein n=1 Tax=Streptomyces echinoruber TaxID=68898 RepID=A0A918V9K2_9ACTN|nr:NAD(P)H-dependent oxidoreductase [Streptomyces echinoruber]GGZ84303.1 hypothetical protein GCM10010389_23130 [Streptomyces echinoruber]
MTRRLTARFAAVWRERHPAGRYRYRDPAAAPVPALTAAYTTLGRRVERAGFVPPAEVPALVRDAAEEREWALTAPPAEEVAAAGTLLLGVPMDNFSVPAALKAWIDRVSFPNAFTGPDGGRSPLRETRVVAVMARGGGYGPGAPRASTATSRRPTGRRTSPASAGRRTTCTWWPPNSPASTSCRSSPAWSTWPPPP